MWVRLTEPRKISFNFYQEGAQSVGAGKQFPSCGLGSATANLNENEAETS
jgi:hypothetical protein